MGCFSDVSLTRYQTVTCEQVPSRTVKQLSKSLKRIVQLYARGDFIICVILMDMEFEKVKDELRLIDVNTTAAREHVAEIERGICLLKERS